MSNDTFEKKIKPILTYVGTIGAVVMCIAYIIAVFVLIYGFKVNTLLQTSIFAVVNAGVGFIIMQFLKVQGISFAKEIPDNQVIIKEYYGTKTKDKKSHSLGFFWGTTVIKDLFIKCLTLGLTSIGLVYIVIVGSNDYNLLLLAVVNLLMFLCFGFLSLVKAYDFFNERFVPYMKEKLEDVKKDMEVAKKECPKQTDDSICTNSGSVVLGRPSSDINNGDNQSNLLGGVSSSIYSSSVDTTSNADTNVNSTGIESVIYENKE